MKDTILFLSGIMVIVSGIILLAIFPLVLLEACIIVIGFTMICIAIRMHRTVHFYGHLTKGLVDI